MIQEEKKEYTEERLQNNIESADFGVKFLRLCRDGGFCLALPMTSAGFYFGCDGNYLAAVPLVFFGTCYYLSAAFFNLKYKQEKENKQYYLSLQKDRYGH